ncbi:MAG: hypothetical protein HZB26_02440 [Candidatus Hydrogenedentes bacterium]|nr:hypothetical protein [Candidatus Hydrogenedentota bacterium]
MLGGIWYNGTQSSSWAHDEAVMQATSQAQTDNAARVREVEREVERLKLLNQALWELLRARLNVTDADLEKVIRDVDLRDGVEDGRMTTTALKCPTCGRVSSSRHWKCLYCGQQFEKPIAG